MGVPRNDFRFGREDSAYKTINRSGDKKHIVGKSMDNVEPCSKPYISKTDGEEYRSFHAECFMVAVQRGGIFRVWYNWSIEERDA